ncbi:MAG: hypothetical protein PHX74_04645 [Candidatus Sumerlaeales bacterium]|nr:hypothetical protein [Candidatus Sumerlaeales bacterium]
MAKIIAEIKRRYDSDPDWGVYDGVLSRGDIKEILDAFADSPRTVTTLDDDAEMRESAKAQIALDWLNREVLALALWRADPALVEPLALYKIKDAEHITKIFNTAIVAIGKNYAVKNKYDEIDIDGE